jgi:adenylate kinase
MLIIFIGPPGAGKGTQSKRLVSALGLVHLSTGELLRQAQVDDSPLGREAARYMNHGRLVPDPLVVQIVVQRLSEPDAARGCLFDGFPRTIVQAESLDRHLATQTRKIDMAIELACDETELARRMEARAKIEHRADDDRETIARRFEVYHSQTEPLLAYYRDRGLLDSIDGMGTPDQVFARIMTAVNRRRSPTPTASAS